MFRMHREGNFLPREGKFRPGEEFSLSSHQNCPKICVQKLVSKCCECSEREIFSLGKEIFYPRRRIFPPLPSHQNCSKICVQELVSKCFKCSEIEIFSLWKEIFSLGKEISLLLHLNCPKISALRKKTGRLKKSKGPDFYLCFSVNYPSNSRNLVCNI